MHIRALALFVFASLTAMARGSAQAQGLQLPAPVGYVNDFAHVIPPDKAAAISAIIDDVKAKSGGEIVVVTLPDLKGRPVEEVGLQIGRQWGVGRKGNPGDPARNTGVILLVVPKKQRRRERSQYVPRSDSAPRVSSPTPRPANSATSRSLISGS